MPARFAAVLVLSLALCAASGCGGKSEDAKFKDSYQPVRVQLEKTSKAIGTAIGHARGQTDAQLLVTFRGLASRWQTQVSRLEAIKAPSKRAADFNTITSAGTRVETDLRSIVAAAATHSAAAARQATASLLTDFLALRQADRSLARKLGLKG
jgi:hypothetical protein